MKETASARYSWISQKTRVICGRNTLLTRRARTVTATLHDRHSPFSARLHSSRFIYFPSSRARAGRIFNGLSMWIFPSSYPRTPAAGFMQLRAQNQLKEILGEYAQMFDWNQPIGSLTAYETLLEGGDVAAPCSNNRLRLEAKHLSLYEELANSQFLPPKEPANFDQISRLLIRNIHPTPT
jgi:hypothetical protein